MCSLEDLCEVVERYNKVIHVSTCGCLSGTDYEGSKLKNIVSNRHVEWVGSLTDLASSNSPLVVGLVVPGVDYVVLVKCFGL